MEMHRTPIAPGDHPMELRGDQVRPAEGVEKANVSDPRQYKSNDSWLKRFGVL